MPALKSVKQLYAPDAHMLNMMNTFRMMINDCIRIGLNSNKTSMKSLSILCYPMLKAYRIDSRYKLCAISKAAGILRNYRKALRKICMYRTRKRRIRDITFHIQLFHNL